MEKHLKSHQYYSDLYDKFTIEECRRLEQLGREVDIPEYEGKEFAPEEKERMRKSFNELHLYFVTGERYKKKSETIDQWMKRDENHDRFFESARAPEGIPCLTCSRDMFVSHKHLDTHLDKPDRVLFMYDCTLGHLPRRAFFDNGEEWKYEKPLCPKCQTPYDRVDEDTDTLFKCTSTCPKCGNVEISEIPRTVNNEEVDSNFQSDRVKFCDEEKGRKYVEWINIAHELSAVLDKQKEKENNKELYDKVAELKKLSVPQLKEYLVESLKDEIYKNLVFEQPTIERIVTIGFSIEDPTDQVEYDSRTKLTRLLKKTLESTNWRLMSDGISYRLGVLTGRFRCYEKEEDLVKLIQE
jgi:hypothetical protein